MRHVRIEAGLVIRVRGWVLTIETGEEGALCASSSPALQPSRCRAHSMFPSGSRRYARYTSREKARKTYDEQMRQNEGRLDASAARAGVVGGQKVEANGSVRVVVQKLGPDTNVRTSPSGNLFKDVVLSRGRTMAPAERS